MTRIDEAVSAGIDAARAAMSDVVDWYGSEASHDFAYNAAADRVTNDAAIRGWEAAALTIRPFKLTNKAARTALDRISAETGCYC